MRSPTELAAECDDAAAQRRFDALLTAADALLVAARALRRDDEDDDGGEEDDDDDLDDDLDGALAGALAGNNPERGALLLRGHRHRMAAFEAASLFRLALLDAHAARGWALTLGLDDDAERLSYDAIALRNRCRDVPELRGDTPLPELRGDTPLPELRGDTPLPEHGGEADRLLVELEALLHSGDSFTARDVALPGIEALLELSNGVHPELLLARALVVHYSADDDVVRRDAAQRALDALPGSPVALFVLAAAWEDDDRARAIALQWQAWDALDAQATHATPPRADVHRRLAAALHLAPTPARLGARLMDLAEQDDDWVAVSRVCDRALAVVSEPGERLPFLSKRAVALTFRGEHDAAIGAYGEALAAIDAVRGAPSEDADERSRDERGLLFFNRACEHARRRDAQLALADLECAVAFAPSWGEAAGQDAYFDELRAHDDPRVRDRLAKLSRGVTGEVSAVDVEQHIDRALARNYRGEGQEAVVAGERAVQLAEVYGDEPLLVRALIALGSALTYHPERGPDASIPVLERAVSIAERLYVGDAVGKRADARTALGAALLARGRLDDAALAIRLAHDERKQTLGPHHPLLAKTLGELARVASRRQRPAADVAALIEEARAILRRTLDDPSAARDDVIEARDDYTNLSCNLAATWLDAERFADAATALEDTCDAFEAASVRAAGVLRNASENAIIGIVWGPAELEERFAEALRRIVWVEHDDDGGRDKGVFWNGVRIALRRLIKDGTPASTIVRQIGPGVTGRSTVPLLNELAPLMVSRLGEGGLVLFAMAFSMAEPSLAGLERALRDVSDLDVA